MSRRVPWWMYACWGMGCFGGVMLPPPEAWR
jgi:hypothetical protein